ncbi:MAG: PilZ domain-containing protein [Desulfobacteraceae bacterium]|nr:PilZ domain-containing protein [Desulfobacteraceae bacterium]
MKICTTKYHAGIFFPDKNSPLEICQPKDIERAFLQGAIPGDMTVMDLPEEYIEFLAASKAKGIPGPFIFILPEPTMIDEQLKMYNAMVLDMEKTEISEIREIVNFIARLTMAHNMRIAADQCAADEISIVEFKTFQREDPVKDPLRIKQALEYILRAELPVIISIQILEDGDPVTARGVCHIGALNGSEITLHRFKPLEFSEAIGEKTQIKLVLSHRDENYEAVSTVLKAGQNRLNITAPDILFIEKRRSIRIEPSRKNPALLYILRKNEPTTFCRVIDISICGLCFETGTEFIKGEVHGLTVVLPGKSGLVLSYGKILYQRPLGSVYRYGVQLNTHPADEDRIANYIMEREKEISTLLSKVR